MTSPAPEPPDPMARLAEWAAARPPQRPAPWMPRVSSGRRGRYFVVRCPSCRRDEYQNEHSAGQLDACAPLRVTCEGCGTVAVAGLLGAPGGSQVVCSITAVAA